MGDSDSQDNNLSDERSENGGSPVKQLSEEELKKEIHDLLKKTGVQEDTTAKKIRLTLEKKLNIDLEPQRKVISQILMDYVNNMDSDKSDADSKKSDDDSDDEIKEELGRTTRQSSRNKGKPKKTPAKGKKKGGVTKKSGGGGGYTRPCKLSPALSELVGAAELPRHEVVKRVWAIIKERQLTDPNNRRFAICDKPLFQVIGTQRFQTFGMMKYLKKHFIVD